MATRLLACRATFIAVLLAATALLTPGASALERTPVQSFDASIEAFTKSCFDAPQPSVAADQKLRAEACSNLAGAIKARVEAEQAAEKGRIERSHLIDQESRKVTQEKSRLTTRETWGMLSFLGLVALNIAIAVIATQLAKQAYAKTDISTLFRESQTDKWSFSRILGFAGGVTALLLMFFYFNVSLAHLFFLGTMPDQFTTAITTLGTLLASQLPYVVNKLTGKE